MSALLFLVLMTALTLGPPLVGGSALPFMLESPPRPVPWFTHPWVHQGPYHLLLDGGAFLALWGMLDRRSSRRWLLLAATNLGSAAAIWITGTGAAGAFGGLSGIAHGLMAVIALDWIRDRDLRLPGAVLLCLLLGKALTELHTGQPFFHRLHLGDIGTPLVACHLGGILGALSAWPFLPSPPPFGAENSGGHGGVEGFGSAVAGDGEASGKMGRQGGTNAAGFVAENDPAVRRQRGPEEVVSV